MPERAFHILGGAGGPHAGQPLAQELVGLEEPRGEAGEDGAEERRHPEHPQLRERPAADEDCGAGRAGGVDRGIGDREVDEVDQGQQRPMPTPASALVPRFEVDPRITMRNPKVITTSARNAPAAEYPPGEWAP